MAPDRPFPHENESRFESLIGFTAGAEGFRPALIEKDYFCSLILAWLNAGTDRLVFRGGTCLGKVYLSFFRMSEDLDFSISLFGAGKRSARRQSVAPLKAAVERLPGAIPGLSVVDPLSGRNESTQYVASVAYPSVFGARENAINIEIALREDLLEKPIPGPVRTLLRDAFTGEDVLPPFPVVCIEFREAMAEKVRAALTRRKPAIRDFYDLDFAIRQGKLDLEDAAFLGLVRRKLATPGTGPLDLSEAKRRALEEQLEAQLRPVLRERDMKDFDMDRAFGAVRRLAVKIEG